MKEYIDLLGIKQSDTYTDTMNVGIRQPSSTPDEGVNILLFIQVIERILKSNRNITYKAESQTLEDLVKFYNDSNYTIHIHDFKLSREYVLERDYYVVSFRVKYTIKGKN